ncbi:MAG: hypothetical protein RLP44_22900 [Aggregatilineales bacterium]
MHKFRLLVIVFCLLLSFPLFGQEDPFPQYQEVGRIGNGTLQQIAWSPDGERLAVVSTIGIFLYTPELEQFSYYEWEAYRADDLIWSPDGRYLSVKTFILGDGDAYWQIYEVADDVLAPRFTDYASVSELVWQDDSLLIVDSSRLYIIAPATNEVVFALDQTISQVEWNATATQLAVTKEDVVTVYDGTTYEDVYSMQGFNGFWWSPDGERLALRSSVPFDDEDSGLLVIYDISSGDEVARLQGELLSNSALELIPQTMVREQIADVLFNSDGCQLVVIHANPTFASDVARAWNICGDQAQMSSISYMASPSRIQLFEWSADDDYFLTFDCCGSWGIPIGYARSIQQDETITLSGHRWQFSPDNRQLAVYGAEQGNVDFYDAETLELSDTFASRGNSIRSVRWSPDGERLAIGRVDSLAIIDATTKSVLAVENSFLARSIVIGWDVSGRYLAIISAGWVGRQYACASVRVWDAQEQNFVASFGGYTPIYLTATWLEDSTQLAISQKEFRYGLECDGESRREIWDVETQELISVEQLEETENILSQMRGIESPDGQYMLVSSPDEMEIWRNAGTTWVLQSEVQTVNLCCFSYASWHPNSQYLFFFAGNEETRRELLMIADVETGVGLSFTSRQGLVGIDGYTGFAWMPDDSGFALGASDGTVTIYEQVP